jgi:hypothetical protein
MDETTGTGGRTTGWIGYGSGPDGKDHLPPDVRAEVERRETLRAERRGRLLCEVLVRVYEHAAIPGVQFPPESALDVESDTHEIAAAVNRARAALASWR